MFLEEITELCPFLDKVKQIVNPDLRSPDRRLRRFSKDFAELTR